MAPRSRLLPGLALAAALAAAGCGGGSRAGHGGAVSWLGRGPPPAAWTVARLPSGAAALAYPPGWRPIRTDPGTVSAALLGAGGAIRGYLNATPLSGAETV